MKSAICLFVTLFPLIIASVQAQTITINFDKDKAGEPPEGFTTALTGRGRPGVWVVVKDGTGNVLAQTDADKTGYRFPVCVFDGLTVKDADISARIKAISGQEDQGGGIVWRYRDKDNYYIVRANALEDNVVLYKVQNGKREDLPLKGSGRTYGKKVKVPAGQWNTLRVTAHGNLFTVWFNGLKLYEVEDGTFTEAGKVGLWTKADSVIHFDDLQVSKPPASVREQSGGKETGQTPIVVFVCEHGAAKSIVAAAHFNRLAEEQHLNLRAIARGTNPDSEISPKAVQGLQADGLAPGEGAPKKISKADLVGARRVITFCTLPDDYPGGVRVEHWGDDLPVGENYNKARDTLVERIRRLLGELRSEQ
ncbi:MAG TPA: family 16 glycoside hydrolase [Blastocatellia bacterium]|nr:family 16 glycoside hydrolase [Blastocatellia bacterium]